MLPTSKTSTNTYSLESAKVAEYKQVKIPEVTFVVVKVVIVIRVESE